MEKSSAVSESLDAGVVMEVDDDDDEEAFLSRSSFDFGIERSKRPEEFVEVLEPTVAALAAAAATSEEESLEC